jgi:hypothetical protein
VEVGLCWTTKKPEPEIATSVEEAVCCGVPCWLTVCSVEARTPPGE